MKITGGCYCGAVRYEIDGEPQASLQCHCRECQYISGGFAAALMLFPLEIFQLTSGEMKQFRRSDLERPVTQHKRHQNILCTVRSPGCSHQTHDVVEVVEPSTFKYE